MLEKILNSKLIYKHTYDTSPLREIRCYWDKKYRHENSGKYTYRVFAIITFEAYKVHFWNFGGYPSCGVWIDLPIRGSMISWSDKVQELYDSGLIKFVEIYDGFIPLSKINKILNSYGCDGINNLDDMEKYDMSYSIH